MTAGRNSADSERLSIIAVGPFPPFVGGAAKNTAIICSALEARGAEVLRLATNKTRERAEHSRSLGYYADRLAGFLSNAAKISSARAATVYLVPDGGPGVAFSAIYARAAVARFPRLVVHHRNYSHLRHRSTLMNSLMSSAPEKTLHVFLDPVMEEQFRLTYSAEIRSIYVPNAATCDVDPVLPSTDAGARATITVGFLSNLVEDKGFDVVAEAFPKLAQRLGPNSRFLLAGRPVGSVNSTRLATLQQDLGDRLEYFGEVSGSVKTEFFRSCDVFVFPTRYSQEAQPNVLYEAMAAGAAIVSTRWAGVPWVLQRTVSRIIEAGPDKGDDLVNAVDDLLRSGDLQKARARQVEAFFAKKTDADARHAQLIGFLLGEENL